MATDRWTVRAVIVFLGTIAMCGVVGGFVLAAGSKPVPTFIVSITGTAVGAVAGILAKTSSDTPVVTSETATVEVQTTPTGRKK